ncbi:MAG: sugar ABC transporter permease [Candidatus Borkfalkiaceae bacterium]|nr:sugar ABC transporter permease [Clostridia bacterium]MDY6222993.1 sugar ABC transporter permease [Christensenellaceae bacterium]
MEEKTAVLQTEQSRSSVKPPEKKKRKFRKSWIMCWIGVAIPLIGFVVFNAYPIVVSLQAMFSSMKFGKLDTMKWNNFANFKMLIGDTKLLSAIKVTLILAAAQFFSLGIALMIAAFLSQNVKGTRIFQTLYFVPYICSTVAVSIMWGNVFDLNGVLNAIFGTHIQWLNNLENPSTLTWAIFTTIIWQAPGYGIVMYCSAFKAISPSLYEAAELDGANAWHKFRYITLPGVSSITFFLILAGFMAGLLTFDAATVLAPMTWDNFAGPEDAGLTIMYYIYNTGVKNGEMGYASILSWLLFIIMVIPSVFLVKKRLVAMEDN